MAILAGPGPEDLRVVTTVNRGTAPGLVEQWMAAHLPVRGMGAARMFHDLRVFDIASGRELADYSTEGEIHVAPNAGTFVVDSGGNSQAPMAEKQCIQIFDIPPRRQLDRIILWPLPVALLAIMISWLVGRRRSARSPQADSGR
jgi:hypothetical protein